MSGESSGPPPIHLWKLRERGTLTLTLLRPGRAVRQRLRRVRQRVAVGDEGLGGGGRAEARRNSMMTK